MALTTVNAQMVSGAITTSSTGNVSVGSTTVSSNLSVYGAGSGTFSPYNDPLVVQGSDYSLLYVKGTNGISASVYSYNASNGWYTGTNNSASYRIGYMSTIDGTGITNAKDGSAGITVTTAGRVFVGVTDTPGGSNPVRFAAVNTSTSEHVGSFVANTTSYTSQIFILGTTRTATSGFNLAGWYSGDGGSIAFQDAEFVFRGDGQGYADGTWNNNGADYAEFFESATGQAIPVGSTVILENNKVRLATESDNPADVIGVVRPKEPSKASMVVGNTAWNKWANKYLTDDFDRYIMEDHDVVEWTDADGKQHSYESHNIPEGITVPTDATIKTHDDKGVKFQHYKLNPAWDPSAEYVNRENRDEWLIIGLIGQVKVLKGQTMGDRWKKMRDVSASVEEWYIR